MSVTRMGHHSNQPISLSEAFREFQAAEGEEEVEEAEEDLEAALAAREERKASEPKMEQLVRASAWKVNLKKLEPEVRQERPFHSLASSEEDLRIDGIRERVRSSSSILRPREDEDDLAPTSIDTFSDSDGEEGEFDHPAPFSPKNIAKEHGLEDVDAALWDE